MELCKEVGVGVGGGGWGVGGDKSAWQHLCVASHLDNPLYEKFHLVIYNLCDSRTVMTNNKHVMNTEQNRSRFSHEYTYHTCYHCSAV